MEGMSKIIYKDKEIFYINYSETVTKEKTIELIQVWGDEYCKHPPKSVLSLANFSDFRFDTEVLNMMKEVTNKAAVYIKKSAVIGMKPIHKAAYNFLLALTADKFVKIFNTETEAKEWLVKD